MREKQTWTLSDIVEGGARSDYHDRLGAPQFCPRDRSCGCDNAADAAIRALRDLPFDPTCYEYHTGSTLPPQPGLYERVDAAEPTWKLVVACPLTLWPEDLRPHLEVLIETYRRTRRVVSQRRTLRILNGERAAA